MPQVPRFTYLFMYFKLEETTWQAAIFLFKPDNQGGKACDAEGRMHFG